MVINFYQSILILLKCFKPCISVRYLIQYFWSKAERMLFSNPTFISPAICGLSTSFPPLHIRLKEFQLFVLVLHYFGNLKTDDSKDRAVDGGTFSLNYQIDTFNCIIYLTVLADANFPSTSVCSNGPEEIRADGM